MNYLITGGAGFIGSHLADALVARGGRVAVLDDLSTGSIDNLAHLLGHERLSFHRGSVLDGALVAALVAQADAVVHLAASVGVRLVLERPLASLINNVRGAEVVLATCAAYGRRVLVASSSEVYGANCDGPLAEDGERLLGSPLEPRWGYGVAKALGEMLADFWWRTQRTPTTVVRLFNVIGPRQRPEFGMVVPGFVRQALLGEPLTVFGDGAQRRCFCHVEDTVRALVALLADPRSVGQVVNVGASEEVTMNDLATLVLGASDSRSLVVHVPRGETVGRYVDEVRRRVPDTSRLRALIGWQPQRTLAEAVADVVEHERYRFRLVAERRA